MTRQHSRRLPQGRQWGLLLFATFIAGLFVEPYQRGASVVEWALTILGVTVFLSLFLAALVMRGTYFLWIVTGDVLLGIAFAPSNTAASILFVYAAAFIPFALKGQPWLACSAIGAVMAILGIESWLLELPPRFWAVGLGYSLVMGAVNIWVSQQAMASDRLRLAHEEIEHLAKAAERDRIARDLHDVLGHTLSVVIRKAELAARLVTLNPAEARSEIVSVEHISREALSRVREAVRGYRTHGLLAEVRRVRSVLEEAGIEVDCRSSALALTAAQDNVLALVLREAVTNVIRHAEATRCELVLEEQKGCGRLTIHDNGRGGVLLEGAGLRGMSERVAAIGGRLVHDVQGGVRLTITVPLAEREEGA